MSLPDTTVKHFFLYVKVPPGMAGNFIEYHLYKSIPTPTSLNSNEVGQIYIDHDSKEWVFVQYISIALTLPQMIEVAEFMSELI